MMVLMLVGTVVVKKVRYEIDSLFRVEPNNKLVSVFRVTN